MNKQIPKLSSRETSEKNSHFSNYRKKAVERWVGEVGDEAQRGINVGWY